MFPTKKNSNRKKKLIRALWTPPPGRIGLSCSLSQAEQLLDSCYDLLLTKYYSFKNRGENNFQSKTTGIIWEYIFTSCLLEKDSYTAVKLLGYIYPYRRPAQRWIWRLNSSWENLGGWIIGWALIVNVSSYILNVYERPLNPPKFLNYWLTIGKMQFEDL